MKQGSCRQTHAQTEREIVGAAIIRQASVSHWVSNKRGAWLIVMMAEFNYFHPPPVVKHADKWANKMAHHHFSIVPSCVYTITRVGGGFFCLHKPESLLIQKGKCNRVFASTCLGLVFEYVHAYEVLIFVRYADSILEHNNDQISSCDALEPPKTDAEQISVCP